MKLNMTSNFIPGIYPRGMKTYIHTKTCKWIFTAAFSLQAEKWKPPKCPSTDEQISKMWYIHIVYPYNGILSGNKKE